MKYQFSIIIPTYNGAKTLAPLLEKLIKITSNYTSEVIIIDSGSTDDTLALVERYKRRLPLRVVVIDKKDFNHGDTRNRGVRLARGKYVCFFSQDVLPLDDRMLDCYLEDFRLDPEVVAVFAENVPYPHASFLQKIEHECRWERLNRYVNQKGVLLQTRKKPFVPYKQANYFLWYFFGNTASCFAKEFLLNHPFPRTDYGEDIMIGKRIIELGLTKVYDTRCAVYHSHEYSFHGYCERQEQSLRLRYNVLSLPEKGQPLCKIKKVLKAPVGAAAKAVLLGKLFIMYLVKAAIYLQLRFDYGRNKA